MEEAIQNPGAKRPSLSRVSRESSESSLFWLLYIYTCSSHPMPEEQNIYPIIREECLNFIKIKTSGEVFSLSDLFLISFRVITHYHVK